MIQRKVHLSHADLHLHSARSAALVAAQVVATAPVVTRDVAVPTAEVVGAVGVDGVAVAPSVTLASARWAGLLA